jgi:hypothetical protein
MFSALAWESPPLAVGRMALLLIVGKYATSKLAYLLQVTDFSSLRVFMLFLAKQLLLFFDYLSRR